MSEQNNTLRNACIVIFLAVLVWSGIGPHDYLTGCLEVVPAIIAGVVLWLTRAAFRLTALILLDRFHARQLAGGDGI